MQLVKLFNTVLGSRYPPLNNIICNINANLIVEPVEQLIGGHLGSVISAIIIGELRERE